MKKQNKYIIDTIAILLLFAFVYSPLFMAGETFYTLKNVASSWFPDEIEEYKLKFVSVNLEGEEAYSSPIEMIFPVEIINMKQQGEFIVIESTEKCPVVCPIDCIVKINDKTKTIEIEEIGYKLELSGFEILGVTDGKYVKRGQVLGTLENKFLYARLSQGHKIYTVEEVRGMIG